MEMLHHQTDDAFHHIMHRKISRHEAGDLLENQQLLFGSLLRGSLSFVARHYLIISDRGRIARISARQSDAQATTTSIRIPTSGVPWNLLP